MNSNKKISVIIPTLQKNSEILFKLLETLNADTAVYEIIILDNTLKGFNFDLKTKFSKAKLFINKKNLFVNPCWNQGVKKIQQEYWALFNDDVIPPPNFCSKILKYLNSETGIIGISSDFVKTLSPTNITDIVFNKQSPVIKETNQRNINFGIIMFGHKSSYYKIPNSMKIWYGDDFLFLKNLQNKKKNYVIDNCEIFHCHSLTSNLSCFDKIKEKDAKIFEFSFNRPLENIFSIKNSFDKKHKNITFCGIKIKVKK